MFGSKRMWFIFGVFFLILGVVEILLFFPDPLGLFTAILGILTLASVYGYFDPKHKEQR